MKERIRQRLLREERLGVTPWPDCMKDCPAAKVVPNLNCTFLCGKKFDTEGISLSRETLVRAREFLK